MKEPTIQEVLELVSFERNEDDVLFVRDVRDSVWGSVKGTVWGNVCDNVWGDVRGNVRGNVCERVEGDIVGMVFGTINRRKWQFVETPKEKAIRLIREGRGDEAIQVLQECD